MALPPGTTDEAFLREVDEELRRDQMLTVWRRWGRWIVALVVIGLVVFAGVLYFRSHSARSVEKQGERFDVALRDASTNQAAKADPEFRSIAASGSPGFRSLARFAEADALLRKNDLKGAAAKFGEIAGDSGAPQPFRDEALLRQTAAEYDQLKPEVVIDRLKGLAVPDSPWFGSAGEMVVAAYIKQGKSDQAGKLAAQIAQTTNPVPPSIRDRARQLAGSLGVDAIDQSKDNNAQ